MNPGAELIGAMIASSEETRLHSFGSLEERTRLACGDDRWHSLRTGDEQHWPDDWLVDGHGCRSSHVLRLVLDSSRHRLACIPPKAAVEANACYSVLVIVLGAGRVPCLV